MENQAKDSIVASQTSKSESENWDLTKVNELAKIRTYKARTSIMLNGKPNTDQAERTYVITGNGRGGTSMVTGVAHLLGLELHPAGSGNLEDRQFIHISQGRSTENGKSHIKLDLTAEEIYDRLRERVDLYNSEEQVWGWKDPSVDNYLPQIQDSLRNPHLIVVFRDVVAVASAIIAADETNNMMAQVDPLHHKAKQVISAEDALQFVADRYARYESLIDELKWPTLLVSYERGRAFPEQLAEEMSEFLGLELTDENLKSILAYIQPTGGYLLQGHSADLIKKKNPLAQVLRNVGETEAAPDTVSAAASTSGGTDAALASKIDQMSRAVDYLVGRSVGKTGTGSGEQSGGTGAQQNDLLEYLLKKIEHQEATLNYLVQKTEQLAASSSRKPWDKVIPQRNNAAARNSE